VRDDRQCHCRNAYQPEIFIRFIGILVGICLISGGFWRIVLGRVVRTS